MNVAAPSSNPAAVGVPLLVTLSVHGITARIVKIVARRFNELEELSSYICIGTAVLTAMLMESRYSKMSIFRENPNLFPLAVLINSTVMVLLFLGDVFLQRVQSIQIESPSLMNMVARARKGGYNHLSSQGISIEAVEKGLRKEKKSERSLLLVGELAEQLSIVEECARQVAAGSLAKDSPLREAEIYCLDITTADVEERKKIALLCERGNVILVIISLEKILDQNPVLATFLKTKIMTGSLTCIGLVTKENLKKIENTEWNSLLSDISSNNLK